MLEMYTLVPWWVRCRVARRAEAPGAGVKYKFIDYKPTSHAEAAPTLQGTQNASVAFYCIIDRRQEATLRRDKFLF